MQHGLNVPPFDALADPNALAELAAEAEAHGWDGFFLWDHVYVRPPVTAALDPWIALAAAAAATTSILLGPMVTPLARRRPQIVARQVAALDLLSRGRVVLGVGLGLDSSGAEFSRFGEVTDLRERAARYDESLTLVEALLSGEPVDHDGARFTARDVRFLPRPAAASVPIWVAGRWPNRAPVRRALRHDGLFVIDIGPGDLAAVRAMVDAERVDSERVDAEPLQLIVQSTSYEDAHDWSDAGATWWLATFDTAELSIEGVRRMIRRRSPA